MKRKINGKTEVILCGTKLYFYMTDNESYVIFRYDGDQHGKVSMYNSDWPQKQEWGGTWKGTGWSYVCRVKFYIKAKQNSYKALIFC